MSPILPRHPSLQHLKKQAKQLLAAHRYGTVQCCPFLRRLHRFADASDEEILATHVTLAEVQLVMAMHYGFASWSALRAEVRAQPTTDVGSIHAVVLQSEEEIPEYAEFWRKNQPRGIEVVGVVMDSGSPDDILDFVREYKIPYRQLLGDDEIAQAFGVNPVSSSARSGGRTRTR